MASREELLQSIHSEMKLNRDFFMKVYGYEISFPGFADKAIKALNDAGCSRAREYYDRFISKYIKKRDKELKEVAAWYAQRQKNGRKGQENYVEFQSSVMPLWRFPVL